VKYWALLYKIKQSSGNIKQIMDALAEIAAKVNFVQECTKSIQRTLPSYFQILFLIVLIISADCLKRKGNIEAKTCTWGLCKIVFHGQKGRL